MTGSAPGMVPAECPAANGGPFKLTVLRPGP